MKTKETRRNKSINENRLTKAVTSRRVAWLLRKDGYRILSVEPNRNRPDCDVYIFDAVPGFTETLEKYIKEQKEFRKKRDGTRK